MFLAFFMFFFVEKGGITGMSIKENREEYLRRRLRMGVIAKTEHVKTKHLRSRSYNRNRCSYTREQKSSQITVDFLLFVNYVLKEIATSPELIHEVDEHLKKGEERFSVLLRPYNGIVGREYTNHARGTKTKACYRARLCLSVDRHGSVYVTSYYPAAE